MLRIVKIQPLQLPTDYLVDSRKHYVISWGKSLQGFNEGFFFSDITYNSGGMWRGQSLDGIVDALLVGRNYSDYGASIDKACCSFKADTNPMSAIVRVGLVEEISYPDVPPTTMTFFPISFSDDYTILRVV
jgi:hypothetical protein